MDELINQVVAKTGISEEQARTAVETVVGFLKERLPAPIAGQVDGAIAGSAGVIGGVGGQGGGGLGDPGGMFGGTKERGAGAGGVVWGGKRAGGGEPDGGSGGGGGEKKKTPPPPLLFSTSQALAALRV